MDTWGLPRTPWGYGGWRNRGRWSAGRYRSWRTRRPPQEARPGSYSSALARPRSFIIRNLPLSEFLHSRSTLFRVSCDDNTALVLFDPARRNLISLSFLAGIAALPRYRSVSELAIVLRDVWLGISYLLPLLSGFGDRFQEGNCGTRYSGGVRGEGGRDSPEFFSFYDCLPSFLTSLVTCLHGRGSTYGTRLKRRRRRSFKDCSKSGINTYSTLFSRWLVFQRYICTFWARRVMVASMQRGGASFAEEEKTEGEGDFTFVICRWGWQWEWRGGCSK